MYIYDICIYVYMIYDMHIFVYIYIHIQILSFMTLHIFNLCRYRDRLYIYIYICIFLVDELPQRNYGDNKEETFF